MAGTACTIGSATRSPESGRPCSDYLICFAQCLSSLWVDTPGSLAFFLPMSRPLSRARTVENMQPHTSPIKMTTWGIQPPGAHAPEGATQCPL